MEEILASIRKIISEDSNDSQPQPAVAPQPVAHAAAQEVDVLELTQEVQEAPEQRMVQQVQPAPAPLRVAQPVRPADDVVFQSIEEAPVTVVAQTPAVSGDGHVSDKTRSALDDAFASLEAAPAEAPAPQPMPAPQPLPLLPGGSVEAVFDRAVRNAFDPVMRAWLQERPDVVAERLKPFIREWMDENLPAIVKSVVEQEIASSRARTKR